MSDGIKAKKISMKEASPASVDSNPTKVKFGKKANDEAPKGKAKNSYGNSKIGAPVSAKAQDKGKGKGKISKPKEVPNVEKADKVYSFTATDKATPPKVDGSHAEAVYSSDHVRTGYVKVG